MATVVGSNRALSLVAGHHLPPLNDIGDLNLGDFNGHTIDTFGSRLQGSRAAHRVADQIVSVARVSPGFRCGSHGCITAQLPPTAALRP